MKAEIISAADKTRSSNRTSLIKFAGGRKKISSHTQGQSILKPKNSQYLTKLTCPVERSENSDVNIVSRTSQRADRRAIWALIEPSSTSKQTSVDRNKRPSYKKIISKLDDHRACSAILYARSHEATKRVPTLVELCTSLNFAKLTQKDMIKYTVSLSENAVEKNPAGIWSMHIHAPTNLNLNESKRLSLNMHKTH